MMRVYPLHETTRNSSDRIQVRAKSVKARMGGVGCRHPQFAGAEKGTRGHLQE